MLNTLTEEEGEAGRLLNVYRVPYVVRADEMRVLLPAALMLFTRRLDPAWLSVPTLLCLLVFLFGCEGPICEKQGAVLSSFSLRCRAVCCLPEDI